MTTDDIANGAVDGLMRDACRRGWRIDLTTFAPINRAPVFDHISRELPDGRNVEHPEFIASVSCFVAVADDEDKGGRSIVRVEITQAREADALAAMASAYADADRIWSTWGSEAHRFHLQACYHPPTAILYDDDDDDWG